MTQNPLQDDVAALQFLIEFVQADLQQISRSERVRTVKNLAWFIGRDKYAVTNRGGSDLSASLEAFQRHARIALTSLASDLGLMPEDAKTPGAMPKEETRSLLVEKLVLSFFVFEAEPWGTRLVVKGSRLHIFLYQVARVFQTTGFGIVRRCKARDCRRVFVKVTKKEFCSTRCQSRVYMRKYREEQF